VHRAPASASSTTVVLKETATDELAALLAALGARRVVVVMDANTEPIGQRVIDALGSAGLRAFPVCYPQRSGLLADEAAVALLAQAVAARSPDALVSTGSGVLTDLTRYVATGARRDFVAFATAASQDGYTSGVAAMEFGGMKTTLPAIPPIAVFAEPSTLAAAPPELTRAGIGDLLAKASAAFDWKLAHVLYGEAFSPEIERRVGDVVAETVVAIDLILEGNAAAVAALFEGLLVSGRAIAAHGSSRPASGCEHHASHYWDLLAAKGLRPHHSHGLQVGCATQFTTAIQQLVADGLLDRLAPPRPEDETDLGPGFDGHDAEIAAVRSEKARFLTDNAEHFSTAARDWPRRRATLYPTTETFSSVRAALERAGMASDPGFLDIDVALLRDTLRRCRFLRARYTVLDLLAGQHRLEDAIAELFG
jgi:glycerol-1-phosphate dehydrogenase [NAD(P)+]